MKYRGSIRALLFSCYGIKIHIILKEKATALVFAGGKNYVLGSQFYNKKLLKSQRSQISVFIHVTSVTVLWLRMESCDGGGLAATQKKQKFEEESVIFISHRRVYKSVAKVLKLVSIFISVPSTRIMILISIRCKT